MLSMWYRTIGNFTVSVLARVAAGLVPADGKRDTEGTFMRRHKAASYARKTICVGTIEKRYDSHPVSILSSGQYKI